MLFFVVEIKKAKVKSKKIKISIEKHKIKTLFLLWPYDIINCCGKKVPEKWNGFY